MAERKIICKIRVGSKLYGTDRPDSDDDYLGVFLPSTEDLLGLDNCPTEWTFNEKNSVSARNTKGDTDCKFLSLKQFFKLAMEGQPGALELFYAPPSHTVQTSPEWQLILDSVDLFISRKGISPFIGFAMAQAHKAVIKGENLNLLRQVAAWGDVLPPEDKNLSLGDHFKPEGAGRVRLWGPFGSPVFKLEANDHGFETLRIAGRQFDPGQKTKVFLNSVKELIGKYGDRVKAAAQDGYDYKSLTHAYRLLSQAKEFLQYGCISFPRPDAALLRSIRDKKYEADYFDEITKTIDEIRQVIEPASHLQKEPNRSKINKLCQEMLKAHIGDVTS